MTEFDDAEAGPFPLAFLAVTVKVYAVLAVSPVKAQPVDAPVSEVEQAAGVVTAGDDVTVNPVSAEPPLAAGAVQLTAIEVVGGAALAVTAVGAPGLPVVTAVDAAEAGPVPTPLVALTVKV